MATCLQAFLSQASAWIGAKESGGQNKYAKGSTLETIFKTAGASAGTAWCAIFVYACAKKAGIAGKLLTKSNYAPGICHNVIKKGGTWIPGPYKTKGKVKPQPGDLILYNSASCHMSYNSNGSVKAWHGYHVGIVYKVTSTQVISIEGNIKGGKVGEVKHSLSAKSIGGYARPKWSKVGGAGEATYGGPLYDTKNDRNDMTIREIGYISQDGKLAKSGGVPVSIINYTTVLGDLYDQFNRNTYGGNLTNTSKLKGNEKIVVDYLLGQGLNAAAACGIAGNLKTDSNYNPSTVDGAYFGISKWTGTTAGQMRSFIGEFEWATSLTGQLDFLIADMQNNHASMLKTIKSVANTTAGVKKAAETFAKSYRKISSTSTRVTVAQAIYANIVVTPPKQTGTTTNPQTANKNCKVINIAANAQKALAVCYRNFEVGLCDTAMLKEWQSKGKATNKGLAYMDNCYLVCYNTKYGLKVEDYIEVVTNSGFSIPCIVAGAYNDVNTPIRFYRENKTAIDMRDWATVTIKQIKNFGKRTKK